MTAPSSQIDNLRQLAQAGDVTAFLREASRLHPSDLAEVLAELDAELRLKMVQALPPPLVSEALAEMEEAGQAEQVLAALNPRQAADIVDQLQDDDAVDLIGDLPPETASRILAHVAQRANVERLLAYGEETAGGLMTTTVVAVPVGATASQAIREIRRQAEESEDFYQVYVVDRDGRLVGLLPLQRLVVAPTDQG